jgi:hypothetical protein
MSHRVASWVIPGILMALAGRCAADNVVVASTTSTNDYPALLEYTPSGAIVREIPVEPPPGITDFTPRDVAIDRFGRAHLVISHGVTNDSNLSLCTYGNPGWSHVTVPNWTQLGVTYYGGMGINNDYLFYPDQDFGSDDTNGIVRFPLNDLSAYQHFEVGDWHAVKIGLNGLLYAIDRNGNCAVFHPETMQLLAQIDWKLHRGDSVVNIAVGPSGDIFTVDLGNDVNHFDRFGDFIEEAADVGPCGDIELHTDGTLVIGLADQHVLVGDRALGAFTSFDLPDANDPGASIRNFLCFTPAPLVGLPDPVAAEARGVVLEGDRIRIPYERHVGQEHALQTSSDLADWTNVSATITGTGVNVVFEVALPPDTAHAYYRIRSWFAPR